MGHWCIWESPTQSHEDDRGIGGEALRVGSVQSGEEEVQDHLNNICKFLKGGCEEDEVRLFSVAPSVRTRVHGQH